MDQKEVEYLQKVLDVADKKIQEVTQKMGGNARDIESMNEYFWENYAEFDEYGYEMYDNKMALKTRLTQQESYGKELARYEKMKDSPYFGRVDFVYEGEEEAETYYVGIGNLSEDHSHLPYVYDWRAPVCGLFYDYDKGQAQFEAPAGVMKGEIARKRQYKIQNGRLKYVIETEMNIDDEILQLALSEQADAKLKNIVTTIQKEQNSIIRDTRHKIMVVQGCAGSGKTSVALHRIAYLLYHNRETLKAAQILILSPNSIFGDYISRILPELGEENVCELTLDDYAYRELRQFGEAQDRYDEIEKALAGNPVQDYMYKQSRDYVKELDRFILQLEWDNMDIKDFNFKKLSMSAKDISTFFYEKFCDVPIFSRLEKIADYMIDERETLVGKNMEEEDRQAVYEMINKMYLTTDLLELYNRFLEETGREESLITGTEIPYEDVYPLLYFKYSVFDMPKRRQVKHLVIDEMQDYSYLQYLIIQKLFHCPMTILGDSCQTMGEKASDVMKFLPKIFGKDIFYVHMNKSYRSTSEILDFAESILSDDIAKSERVDRHGEKTELLSLTTEDEMWDAIAEEVTVLQEKYTTAALLCISQEDAGHCQEEMKKRNVQTTLLKKESMKFNQGVSVMPFYLAKGLEFDAVLIPDSQNYQTPLQKQALYINATRALHFLRLYQRL
ncbi:MAG: HelD family protein [Muricoprocola sp.]